MQLSLEDRLDLHEIPSRYADAIDDRNWDVLRAVFTEDAVYDLTGLGSRVLTGLDEIITFMEDEAQHPRAHLMTNVYANKTEEGADLRFRIIAFLGQGKVGTASYYDKVVKTPEGWRVAHRICTLRRPDKRDAKVDVEGIAL